MRHSDGHEMTSIYEHALDPIPEEAMRPSPSPFGGIRALRPGERLRLGVATLIMAGALVAGFVTRSL